jgi:hypothetical protein
MVRVAKLPNCPRSLFPSFNFHVPEKLALSGRAEKANKSAGAASKRKASFEIYLFIKFSLIAKFKQKGANAGGLSKKLPF